MRRMLNMGTRIPGLPHFKAFLFNQGCACKGIPRRLGLANRPWNLKIAGAVNEGISIVGVVVMVRGRHGLGVRDGRDGLGLAIPANTGGMLRGLRPGWGPSRGLFFLSQGVEWGDT